MHKETMSTIYYKTKRVFDVTLTLVVLALSFPLFIAISIAVWLTSDGSVIFRQRRIGWKAREFTMYKFRTMKVGTNKSIDLVTRDDPRVTSVGRFLRATHLDELPQLFNILKGDMSLVGPRPEEFNLAQHLAMRIPGYTESLDMMPGLTGLSQLCGREKVNRLGRRFEVKLHRWYRRNRSLAYDALLVMATIPHMLFRRGV
jgi:lipopolysaccharide/colanic/teichoic acid biosynthesis glycosyltransferase